jgi:hypothetical protein
VQGIIVTIIWENHHGPCSSTKLAELSKPEIPNIAAENPKNKAFIIVPDVIGFQFMLNISNPFMKINQTDASTNKLRVVRW